LASNDHISKAGRLARALELKTRGLTYAEISQRMAEEGYWHVSLRTINRLLNSLEAQTYVEELKRLQLRDITIAEIPLRLKYRDRLLDKMMPRKVEQKIEGQQTIVVKVWKPDNADTGDGDKVFSS
jgi:orotate phosphoribosyltransferase-like protein